MGFLIFLVLFLAIGVGCLIIGNKMQYDPDNKYDDRKWQKFTLLTSGGIFCFVFLLSFIVSSFYTPDQGEGAILTQFGRVYDETSEAGFHGKRPWADTVKWRIRLKSFDEKIDARTSDDMNVTVDMTIWWAVSAGKLKSIYSTVAKDYETLEKGFVVPGVRSAIRDEVAKVTYREFNLNRDKYSDEITKYVSSKLQSKYIFIDKVNIRNLVPPEQVNKAIEAKLKAQQDAEAAEYEIQLSQKRAQVKREDAKGIADAQKIIQQKLTPLYVQWYAVDAYKELAKSDNTTFVIMPTSSNGAGMPLILGTK